MVSGCSHEMLLGRCPGNPREGSVRADVVEIFLKLALIPYAIAVVMPTWRWLLGVTLVISGLLSALWIQYWIVTSDPLHHEGVGAALGVAMALIVTAGFATGVVVRGFALLLRSRGLRSRYVVMISVAGFVLVPAMFTVPSLWSTWTHRPPSEACQKSTFEVKVAGVEFVTSAKAPFNIYLGRTSGRDAYYFHINSSLREFCALNKDGTLPVEATHISLSLRNFGPDAPDLCADPVAEWASTYCTAYQAARRGKEDEVDFPYDLDVFAADQVNMGEFLGSRSTHEDSLKAPSQPTGYVFVGSDIIASGQPVVFKCHDIDRGGAWCQTSYPWRDGANLGYAFRSARDEIAARGTRIDSQARRFLAGFMPRH
jgi:hypothetical protein